MFETFEKRQFRQNSIEINYRIAGSGPPLLLLHGYPQTHVIWHKIAPSLSKNFTVIASDLRGYGDSSKPPSDPKHKAYSKREMARDQVMLMKSLGYDNFHLVGHDRGGRVGHRMALDYPETLLKMIVLDIAPTLTMYETTDLEFAKAYYHWFFLIQPFDLPEQLISSKPIAYLKKKFGQWGRDNSAFTSEAMDEYIRCFTPETIHSSCEDYRASASIDLEHDRESLSSEQKILCPVLCLWGEKGFVGQKYKVVEEWMKWAEDVVGHGLPCGHYLPEEAPELTLKSILEFI